MDVFLPVAALVVRKLLSGGCRIHFSFCEMKKTGQYKINKAIRVRYAMATTNMKGYRRGDLLLASARACMRVWSSSWNATILGLPGGPPGQELQMPDAR